MPVTIHKNITDNDGLTFRQVRQQYKPWTSLKATLFYFLFFLVFIKYFLIHKNLSVSFYFWKMKNTPPFQAKYQKIEGKRKENSLLDVLICRTPETTNLKSKLLFSFNFLRFLGNQTEITEKP